MPRTRTQGKPIPWPLTSLRTPANTQSLWRGLSLAWPLWHFGERHAVDVSGCGLHGVFGSALLTTDWTTLDHGPAVSFGGNTEDKITVADPPSNLLDGTSALSIEVMFVPSSLPAAGEVRGLAAKYQPVAAARSWRFSQANIDELQLQVSSDGTNFEAQVSTDANLVAGTLYQAIATFNAGDFHLYLNGVEKSNDGDFTSQTSIYGGTREFIVGQQTSSGGSAVNLFLGQILSVRVWLRALAAEEIRSLWDEPFRMYERAWAIPSLALLHSGGAAAGQWYLDSEVLKGVQTQEITDLLNGVSYDVQFKTVDTSGNESTGSSVIAGTPAAPAKVARSALIPLVGGIRAPAHMRGRR